MNMALNKICTYRCSMFRSLREVVSQRCLLPVSSFHSTHAQSGSNRTSVVRCGRQKYERMYPVLLVRPDGSTINIKYKDPRRIIMLPVDINTLSEEEKKARMKKRDPKRRLVTMNEEDFKDEFKVDDYSKFWKKT